jgi:hypothetical protein
MKINIYSAAAIAFISLFLGIWIGSAIAQQGSSNCDSPANLRSTIVAESSEVLLEWNHGTTRASGYMVLVYDEVGGQRTFYRMYQSDSNSLVINDLLPKRSYYFELLSRCGTGQGGDILPDVLNGTFNTQDFIIVDEVVHIITPDARRTEVCDNMVNCSVVESPGNTFTWLNAAGGKEYYNIQIRTRALPQTLVMNAILVKDFTDPNQKRVTNFVDLVCGGPMGDALNEPSKSACSPVRPNILCGNFFNGSTVSYEVVILASGCSFRFTDPAQAQNYSVTINRCTGAVD